ncbi:MAG: transglutaminase domain-containing protein [Chloroflexota bacterium]
MRTTISHVTRLEYDADVTESVIDVRLGPLSDADQNWTRFDLRVRPTAGNRSYLDGLGNAARLITIARPHRYIEIVANHEVHTVLNDPFSMPDEPPPPLVPTERIEFLTPSRLVEISDELIDMAEPYRPRSPDDTLESVQSLMTLVHGRLEYETGWTDVTTTIREILEHNRGVCQDFTHVLIGLCRAIGIPARYVSGYIITMPDSQRRGTAASHAWVEAFTPTHGWRGFDPTNNVLASLYHVKMARGRDYQDVPPTRGTYRGHARETLSVRVETAASE